MREFQNFAYIFIGSKLNFTSLPQCCFVVLQVAIADRSKVQQALFYLLPATNY